MVTYGLGERSVEDRASVQVRLCPWCSHVQVPCRWLLMVERVPADDEKSCMLLVMRTLSIVPLNFKVCVSTVGSQRTHG